MPERQLQGPCGLLVGVAMEAVRRDRPEVLDGLVMHLGPGVVQRQELLHLLRALTREGFQASRGGGVQLAAPRREEASIGDVLSQGVLEHPARLRLSGPLVEERQAPELGEVVIQLPAPRQMVPKHSRRELPPEHRGSLEHRRGSRAGGRSCHEDALDRLGHVSVGPEVSPIAGRASEFLEEEGVSLAAPEDCSLEGRLRRGRTDTARTTVRLSAGPRGRRATWVAQARSARGRRVGRAVRPKEDRRVLQRFGEGLEDRFRGRVDPVQILDCQHQRSSPAPLEAHARQGLEHPRSDRLRAHPREELTARRHAQQVQQEGRPATRVHADLRQRELRLRC